MINKVLTRNCLLSSHRFPTFFTAFFVVLIMSQMLSADNFISYLESKAEKGEGIYGLLRRNGLNADNAGVSAFKSINRSKLTQGDALFPGEVYKLPVIVVTFDLPYDEVLRRMGVSDYSQEVFEYNKKHNKGFQADNLKDIAKGQELYIPELGSGFYKKGETSAAPVLPADEGESEVMGEYSVPYPDIKKKFKKGSISNKLAKYCFVLDAGHGGDDPGTNPVVMRGDGLETHTYEAPLAYDTTLRLMKHIIENGGEAFLTHFSEKYGIREVKNPQDYREHRYNLSSRDIRTDTPAQSLRERKKITSTIISKKMNKGKTVVFLSIHADYLPNKTRDLPITVYYSRHTGIDGGRSKTFARNLAKAITGSAKNSKSQGLGVLYKNPARYEVLIELANLNNQHGAWRLRYHDYRERLAKKITDGLIVALP